MRHIGFLFVILSVFGGLLGCHHHTTHHTNPYVDNPATYSYTATPLLHHQPGFFSCIWHQHELYTGSYQRYDHGKGVMKAQLCRLNGNKLQLLHEFDGESIYNLYSYDHYLVMPVEQGALWRRDDNNTYSIIHSRHLHMGHYCFAWTQCGWVTSEKDTVHAKNKSQIWLNNKLFYESSDYTWKEFVVQNNVLYLASYFIHKHTEGGLLKLNLNTAKTTLVFSKRWTACYCVGIDSFKRILYILQHGNTSTIYTLSGPMQEIPHIAWRIRLVGNTTFLLASENGWRKYGDAYIYVLDTTTKQFKLVVTIPHGCELWDICQTDDPNTFYAVSRDEKSGNIGTVFVVNRHK